MTGARVCWVLWMVLCVCVVSYCVEELTKVEGVMSEGGGG